MMKTYKKLANKRLKIILCTPTFNYKLHLVCDEKKYQFVVHPSNFVFYFYIVSVI